MLYSLSLAGALVARNFDEQDQEEVTEDSLKKKIKREIIFDISLKINCNDILKYKRIHSTFLTN